MLDSRHCPLFVGVLYAWSDVALLRFIVDLHWSRFLAKDGRKIEGTLRGSGVPKKHKDIQILGNQPLAGPLCHNL